MAASRRGSQASDDRGSGGLGGAVTFITISVAETRSLRDYLGAAEGGLSTGLEGAALSGDWAGAVIALSATLAGLPPLPCFYG